MDTKTLIIPNKINTFQVDLALRASVVLPTHCREDKVGAVRTIATGAVCVADSGADMGAPAAYGPRTTATMPAPLSTVAIGGPVQGLRVSAGMTHLQSNRGKAATKSTQLGRSSCSPPV